MARKKGGGSSRNGRDSQAKRLGKEYAGERVTPAAAVEQKAQIHLV